VGVVGVELVIAARYPGGSVPESSIVFCISRKDLSNEPNSSSKEELGAAEVRIPRGGVGVDVEGPRPPYCRRTEGDFDPYVEETIGSMKVVSLLLARPGIALGAARDAEGAVADVEGVVEVGFIEELIDEEVLVKGEDVV
jgi:hypothetical protein